MELEQEFSPVEVKQEPSDECLLILPPAPDESATDQVNADQDAEVKPKRRRQVEIP